MEKLFKMNPGTILYEYVRVIASILKGVSPSEKV